MGQIADRQADITVSVAAMHGAMVHLDMVHGISLLPAVPFMLGEGRGRNAEDDDRDGKGQFHHLRLQFRTL
jgi:hypothetical protein